MADTMLALGDYHFSLDSAAYDKLQREASYQWAAQERFGQGPALQFTGWGAEKITLSGVIYPGYRGGLTQLDKMRAAGLKGVPLTLVNGAGYLLGDWVITGVEGTDSEFLRGGLAQKVEFSLHLERYDTDADAPQTTSNATGGTWGGPYDPGPTPGEVHPAASVEQTYLSRAGDTLDNVLARHYGTLVGRVLEKVYGSNRGLADLGAVIPGGVQIKLPALPSISAAKQLVRLWS